MGVVAGPGTAGVLGTPVDPVGISEASAPSATDWWAGLREAIGAGRLAAFRAQFQASRVLESRVD